MFTQLRQPILLAIITTQIFCLGLSFGSAISEDEAGPPPNVRSVTLLSRNLYYGADLSPLTALASPFDAQGNFNTAVFFGNMMAVESVYAEIVASDFRARASVLAREIAEVQPTLIGLQEVATFTTQPFGPDLQPIGEETIEMNYLEMLLEELAALDLHYEAVVIAPGTDAAIPGLFRYIRMVDHEVILARTDLKTADLKLSNPQWDVFNNVVQFETGGGTVQLRRSWAAIDAKIRGQQFRLISTHLNVEGDNIQLNQTLELLEGPANTALPVVMVGDFNSAAGGAEAGASWNFPSDAYNKMLDAGFEDAWHSADPDNPGLTIGQDPFLDNEESNVATRIDLIMYRAGTGRGVAGGRFTVSDVGLVGDQAELIAMSTIFYPGGITFTFPIFWPSDHVGVHATLQLSPR